MDIKEHIKKNLLKINLKANLQNKLKNYILKSSLAEVGLFFNLLEMLKIKYNDPESLRLIEEGIVSNIKNFSIDKERFIHNFYKLFVVPCRNTSLMKDLILFLDVDRNIELEERINKIEVIVRENNDMIDIIFNSL
jgi:hypothetical protein